MRRTLWIVYSVRCTVYIIKTEEKAKVIASVWGEEFIIFLATLAVLPRTILNNTVGLIAPG